MLVIHPINKGDVKLFIGGHLSCITVDKLVSFLQDLDVIRVWIPRNPNSPFDGGGRVVIPSPSGESSCCNNIVIGHLDLGLH